MKYIEDITHKAGAYKKFSIFTKMLVSAAKNAGIDQQNSMSMGNQSLVSLNLLSQQDLMNLKQ